MRIARRHQSESTHEGKKPSGDDLSRALVISLAAHLGVVSALTLKMVFMPSEPINYMASVRVDLVGLPDKINRPPDPAPPAPKARETPEVKVPAPEPKAVDLRKKQRSAIERLKALQEIENEVSDEQKPPQKKSSSEALKGNILAPGTALRGLNRFDYDAYIGSIDGHIKRQWVLPEWLARSSLRARVLVRIDKVGIVIEKKLVLSSGNNAYDSLALNAVANASPFPAPPEKFRNLVEIDGIIFQFPD